MKKLLLVLGISSLSLIAFAQDFPYGQVDNAALQMKKYDKDTSAHALVLNEYGTSRITFDNDYNIRVIFERHIKIKFFDNKDFESEGTFVIPVYNSDQQVYEDVDNVKGVTFYTDDNSGVQKAELDPNKVFRVRENKHLSSIKFAMPALRNGCVIEVSYRIVSPYTFNFQSWAFQGHIPKANSTYEVHIPGFWTYNASLKGYLKLTTNKATVENKCFTYGTASADCSDIIYGIADVPAFRDEDYMTSENNFKSAINFQLVEFTDLNGGAKTKYSKEWKDIDYILRTDTKFGGQLKRKELMKERTQSVIAGKTDPLEKAKAIYNYIKSTIKWNERTGAISEDGIKQALDNHAGDSGDINLALVTALNAAGIPTEAVLLSTRNNGNPNKLYPNLDNFNYVIARAHIGDKSYLIDATEPVLPFGMLPMRCLNDQGRAYSLDKPSEWVDIVTDQRENTIYTLDLTLLENGKLKGTISRYSTGYSGYLKRRDIQKFNSVDEYVENLGEKLRKTKIAKSTIENLDSLDKALGETYEVEMTVFDDMNHNRLTFSPFILNQVTTNPFKLAERDYPVDWGMPSDERYIVNIHLPAQYVIENPPQGMSFAMPNQAAKFISSFEGDSQNFTFSYDTRFNKSVYSPDEYANLKELYNKIVLAEKNELEFKKK